MEKAILVNLSTNQTEKLEAEESMTELAGLALAAGAQVVRKVFQVRSAVSPKLFIGEGKVEEINRIKDELGAELIIFDHNLRPSQQRGLENALQVKVIDRTQLILDIFAQRARSNEGKLQVELAQLSYLLPRLVGKGIALSRLGGSGIGPLRGPGEKKLEEDRRRIQDRIAKIKREIRNVQKRRASQRQSRKESLIPLVSLVGYTSVGKSSLFNALAQETTFTSSQLFATLDPLVRRAYFSDGLFYFLSDTVGFIKKLPVELVTSFKATLEEVNESDCIIHVIDLSAPGSEGQAEAVSRILSEIGASGIPSLRVYNKIDLLPDKDDFLLKNQQAASDNIYVSAKSGEGLPALKAKLRSLLYKELEMFELRVPKDRQDILDSLPRWSLVLKKQENGDYYEMQVMANPQRMLDYLPYLERGEKNW
jgi:GTP-binding protein HflX